jgi:hypothetical protein
MSKAKTEKEILHFMTQDNQPYGSQRRCCERCGVMIWGVPQPPWTDERKTYDNPPAQYISCDKARKTSSGV